jgi:hypothetical protein
MGDWTAFRRCEDGISETLDGLDLDRAFGRMLTVAGFNWTIAAADAGGYRLIVTLRGRRLKPPRGGPMTLTEFSAPILSHHNNRRLAEREIKLEVLMRGCDGVEAKFKSKDAAPPPLVAGRTDPALAGEAVPA